TPLASMDQSSGLTGCFYRQVGDVAQVIGISRSCLACLARSQVGLVAHIAYQFTKRWRLPVPQARNQNVFWIEKHEHGRAPRGVRAHPLPLLVEIVSGQREVGMWDL